jgi:hypothetical protein
MVSAASRLRKKGRATFSPITPGAKLATDERKQHRQRRLPKTTDPGDDTRAGLWHPQPGPQSRAAACEATIIGYGGQAGGGKSDLGIGLALTQHYKATIYRRQRTDAKDLVKRAKEVAAGTYANLNNADLVMGFDDGGFVEFAGLKNPNDWEKKKGRDRDYIFFDEATEFTRLQVTSLIGWLRSTKSGQRKRAILTFNPPTSVEGEWVLDFFAPWLRKEYPNPARDGEVRWFATVEGEWTEVESSLPFEHKNEAGHVEKIFPISVAFFRARLSDNAYLSGDDDYLRSLNSVPEPLRSQLLYGDWDASKVADPWQILPTDWVLAAQERWKDREEDDHGPLTALGVDVARGGVDTSAIAPRYLDFIDRIRVHPGIKTPDGATAAAKVMEVLIEAEDHAEELLVNVDAIGYGSAAAETLSQSQDGLPSGYGVEGVQAVNVGSKSEYLAFGDRYKCGNLRAELYFKLREMLDPKKGATLALPPGRDVLSDLCAARYKIKAGNLLFAESKEDLKKRIGRSPDVGDAILLSICEMIYDPDAPKASKPIAYGLSRRR